MRAWAARTLEVVRGSQWEGSVMIVVLVVGWLVGGPFFCSWDVC